MPQPAARRGRRPAAPGRADGAGGRLLPADPLRRALRGQQQRQPQPGQQQRQQRGGGGPQPRGGGLRVAARSAAEAAAHERSDPGAADHHQGQVSGADGAAWGCGRPRGTGMGTGAGVGVCTRAPPGRPRPAEPLGGPRVPGGAPAALRSASRAAIAVTCRGAGAAVPHRRAAAPRSRQLRAGPTAACPASHPCSGERRPIGNSRRSPRPSGGGRALPEDARCSGGSGSAAVS